VHWKKQKAARFLQNDIFDHNIFDHNIFDHFETHNYFDIVAPTSSG